MIPKVGEVYERDGRRRQIARVDVQSESRGIFELWWYWPGKSQNARRCWCSTWNEWVSKATKIMEAPNVTA